jgi:hypothetical protein
MGRNVAAERRDRVVLREQFEAVSELFHEVVDVAPDERPLAAEASLLIIERDVLH